MREVNPANTVAIDADHGRFYRFSKLTDKSAVAAFSEILGTGALIDE
jgi:hypothetical protein